MPTSLLMDNVEIAKILMEHGPQSINQIKSFMRNLSPVYLEHVLDFLKENKIITQEITGVNLIYTITGQGIGLLEFFRVKPSRAKIS